ncbi:hypothetical protein LOTGIDRAFT_164456 [Lottia gigantea]|uniref:DUF3517 domain-containing protein n=1 Tax=Lottia gigantea TaxID=225164 RepID=V4A554_LOTGI|nr:hypothetical protein LOTGIDRAFT_164456 [Lottia gigantea]ESO90145.1 hypothetical protein LOTGIDRAFT_164456 [Lottia gigantea]
MTESDWWPQQILIKCPNQIVRQMFKCLVIHIISQLRSTQVELYMEPIVELEDGTIDVSQLGQGSCVTRFIRKMLTIIEHGVRPHSKYLSEYFAFLLEFAKAGNEEAQFLIHINAISTMVTFYMGQKAQENYVEILSDDEEEEDVISLTDDNYRPISLEKMITLIALLVEKARTNEKRLRLSNKDKTAIMGGKGFPFLFNQIRDNINIRETCNLIFNLTRWNGNEAVTIVNMIFAAIKKLTPELSQPFFKLLSLLVDYMGAPAGTPHYTQYILHKFWELAKACPQQCLEWLAGQVTRNKAAQAWCLSQMDLWVECYLIAHSNLRVRNAAAYLLVALVPSVNFRQAYRPPRSYHSPLKEIVIYSHLLSLLSRAKAYVDPQVHGTTKLTCYFAVLTYCLNSRAEKLMFSEYFIELWQLFHPKLSEPNISMHQNKQVLLLFWHQVCVDCVENIRLIVNNPHVCKNIAFNYILADHDDQDVVMFNKLMLPSYYGLLRMCCQQDRNFTRLLAQHQNIQWAFKNITPYPAQYTVAVEELFRMMKLMAAKNDDTPADEIKAINAFRHSTLSMYLSVIDARSMWQTLISAFKLLVESQEEKLDVVFHGGLQMITEAFNTLHAMFYEATACHVTGDIVDLLTILLKVLETAREIRESRSEISSRVKTCFAAWKERMEFVKKILTLLNSYTPPEVRQVCFDLLKQMVLTFQGECISTIIPILTAAHTVCQDNSLPVVTGPYFPRRGQKPFGSKSTIRPPRPQFMMCLNTSQIEHSNGVDEVYDQALTEFFQPYHMLVDVMCRVAVNQQNMSEALINLSAMVACEGVPLQLPFFAMLWYEIYQSEQVDRNYIKILCSSNAFIDYVDAVLLDERRSLNNQIIYPFFCNFFPKVVDVRALLIIFSVQMPKQISPLLMESLQYILKACRLHQQQRIEAEEQTKLANQKSQEQAEVKETSETKDEESGETPSKRRKISTEEEEKEEKSEEKESEPSTSAITDVTEEKSPGSPSTDSPSTSTADSNQPSTSASNRHHQTGLLFNREKPNKVDMVATQIQKLLTLIEKKSTKK